MSTQISVTPTQLPYCPLQPLLGRVGTICLFLPLLSHADCNNQGCRNSFCLSWMFSMLPSFSPLSCVNVRGIWWERDVQNLPLSFKLSSDAEVCSLSLSFSDMRIILSYIMKNSLPTTFWILFLMQSSFALVCLPCARLTLSNPETIIRMNIGFTNPLHTLTLRSSADRLAPEIYLDKKRFLQLVYTRDDVSSRTVRFTSRSHQILRLSCTTGWRRDASL